jgi:MFS family permease
MSVMPRAAALAPFRVRSFRFQWPSDLGTSWAFEMETLILGWYVFVETRSVLLLTIYGSLQWLGTLISPMFGVVGDRVGHRNLLCAMRIFYTTQATVMMTLAFTGVLSPVHVFVISTLMGLVRPSDLVMRYALVGETMPAAHLMGAMSIERTTSDSARVVGALTGAGLVAALGMGPAYVVIVAFYAVSLALTLGIARKPARPVVPTGSAPARVSPWRDLRDAVNYVRTTPVVRAAMWLAFLVNLTAYPLVLGLLPYVAKEIYQTDQTGLGYLVASFASGALLGSIFLTHRGSRIRAARWMVVFCGVWYVMLAVFAQMPSLAAGIVALMLAGCAQSFGLVPMSALLLRNTDERYRGRIMGLRMFAIYGLPIGLLVAGPIIERFSYPVMATIYCAIGITFTLLIAVRWRGDVWRREAPANRL